MSITFNFDIDPTPKPTASGNPLRDFFDRHDGRLMTKWAHYFDIYHRHFARFRGTACTVVEIGIYHGGSLEMWRDYFGPKARIIGVDIEERARALAAPGTEIMIGDQEDPAFLQQIAERAGSIDVLIDDGGHTMAQQINTLLHLYPVVQPNGVFLVEDLHTSYWTDYGGGYREPFSFIEFAKTLIDKLNAWHSRDPHSFSPDPFTRSTDGLHFYDSMLVLEKRPRNAPQSLKKGKPFFPDLAERPSVNAAAAAARNKT